MSTTAEKTRNRTSQELEFATFYVGDILLGVNIQQVEEINRTLNMTFVPQAPECVRGLVNLRGEVVMVVDLRTALGLETAEITVKSRNVIVRSGGEQIGLLVDRVADVVRAQSSDMEPPPANVSGVEGRYFKGIYKLESELLVILDVDEVLAMETVVGAER